MSAVKRQTVVISAFPGTGKTHYTQNSPEWSIKDSDSSQFPREGFPRNYVDSIEKDIASGDYDIILVSTHDVVRDELTKRGIKFPVVCPYYSSKDEYLRRYVERGSDEAFTQLMDKRWDEFIDSCLKSIETWVLSEEQYLSDIALSIYNSYRTGPQFMDIRKAVDALNSAFAADPGAIHALLCNRVPANAALADDPFVVCEQVPVLDTDKFCVGALGLVNGVLAALGLPAVAMKFSVEEGISTLNGFAVYVKPKEDDHAG